MAIYYALRVLGHDLNEISPKMLLETTPQIKFGNKLDELRQSVLESYNEGPDWPVDWVQPRGVPVAILHETQVGSGFVVFYDLLNSKAARAPQRVLRNREIK